MSIKIKSYCKFNLFLKILNYSKKFKKHKIFSIFVLSKKLFDIIEIFKTTNDSIEIIYQDKDKNQIYIENNLIEKTISFFENFYNIKISKWKFIITKNIPIGSGLGGGSSNSAYVLNWLYKQYKIPKNKEIPLLTIATKLGSDIPFFLSNYSVALVSDFGNKIDQISLPNISHSIIINKIVCKTKLIFDTYKKLKNKNFGYQNDLMPVAFHLYPILLQKYKKLLKKHSNVLMSGSGSSFIIIHSYKKRGKYE